MNRVIARIVCYVLALVCFAFAFFGDTVLGGHDAVAAGLFLVVLAWLLDDSLAPAWNRGRA